MDNTNGINNNNPFDLGSEPVGEDFDPFAADDAANDTMGKNTMEGMAEQQTPTEVQAPTQVKVNPEEIVDKKTVAKEKESAGYTDKPPVFEYAGATENIDDTSKTFDELRIEKAADFPELEDGKRVSWTVEYGKITKPVADPKGMSIGKMKADIETSKAFLDALNKAKDKKPVCKVKPRVTAQSKGQCGVASTDTWERKTKVFSSYKAVFTNLNEALAAGKVISIVPAKDGNVYEIRNTKIGQFITPVSGCELLDQVRAGFIPALPLIPMRLMMEIVSFFRYYMQNGNEQEVLVNVYWDKQNKEFLVDAPEQTVTKMSVESLENLDYAQDRYIHYMDIHSHNSMKAFFSGIDDNDEQATRLYTVIGRLDKYYPDVKTRISNGGKFLEIDPGEVFELVAGPFPDEWKSKVRFRVQHGDNNNDIDAWSMNGVDTL